VTALAIVFLALLPFLADRVSGQTSGVPSRISAVVDNTKLTVLRGNTHPLARAEFDRGPAPASLPMEHMMLVLTRSAQQETALETLLAQQQDRSSANYHKWLTPEQFGQQFGPSDQDVQTITSWLQSSGFQVNSVAAGRTTIDFSGTAGQVQAAFHTAIHSYVLTNGEQHWANSSDPQIPTALTPVVAGVNSLNNFPRKPLHHAAGVVRKSAATGKFERVSPQFTFAAGCNGTNTNCYGIGPGDFATIYNLQSLLNSGVNGTGQTIAIVSDSDVYSSDVTSFRSNFGLAPITFNQIETGSDPGVVFSNGNGDEVEAILDVEWSGAVAQGATIDLVVSPTTNTTFGGDTSAMYIINGHISPLPQVLSYSYGTCELSLGTSGNQFYNTEWQQAAAEGITVVVATGDNGSAGCDVDQSTGFPTQPAEYGLQVNGLASTPYNVAVGGTDFNDITVAQANTYFATTSGTLSSAKGYIPETTYNDTCTNSIIYSSNVFNFSAFASAEAACNNSTVQSDGFVVAAGGSGGVSACTTPNGPSPSNCSGGYAKPSWQTGPGVPADGHRDLPDVSLFAGDGTIQNFYIVCESDLAALEAGTVPAACSLASPYEYFIAEGGTSVSTQAFAGVVALIDQKLGSRQGNINPLLYALASGSSAASVFNDITVGTNAMPCIVETGVTGCTITGISNPTPTTIGILNGYNAGAGFDLATGLGSVNIGNLVNGAAPTFYLSSSNPVVTIASPGASGTLNVTAYPVNGYTGTVNLACSNLPTAATCTFNPTSVVFTSSTSATTGIPVVVTVNTTSASMISPANRPGAPLGWVLASAASLGLAIFLTMMFAGPQRRQFGWSLAGMLLGLSLLTVMSACGGGSSTTTTTTTTTTTGSTGNTGAVLTGTASGGSPTSSMNFTVTIQ
jgi:subtilase family serine protease